MFSIILLTFPSQIFWIKVELITAKESISKISDLRVLQ